jgi:hypothetical protein
MSEGPALKIAPFDDDFTTFLLRPDVYYFAPPMALHVNRPIPISLYFCFLYRMVVGSIEDLPR